MDFILYARHERTTDGELLKKIDFPQRNLNKPRYQDVIVYYDPECTVVANKFPWFYNSKPDKRNKYISHDCTRYKLIWKD